MKKESRPKRILILFIILVIFLISTNPSLLPLPARAKEWLYNAWSTLFGSVENITNTVKINWVSIFQLIAITLVLALIYNVAKWILESIKPKTGKGKSAHSMVGSFLIYAVCLLWKDDYKKSALMFVIGFSGVLHTHVLTCELAIFMVFMLLAASPKKTFVKKRILSLAVSAGCVLIANLSYIVPFMDIALSRSINAMKSTASKKTGFLNQIVSSHLMLLVTISFVPVIIALLIGGVKWYKGRVFSEKKDGEKTEKEKVFSLGALILLTALFLILSTSAFPWKIVVDIPVIGSLFVSLQFPWRFLTLAGILATVLVCEFLSGVDSTEQAGQLIWICVILFMMIPGLFYSMTSFASRKNASFAPSATAISSYWNSQHEYLVEGTDPRDLTTEYTTSGDVRITSYEKDGTSADFMYESANGGAVELPVFNYPHYEAKTESGETLKIADGSNHRISVEIPAGTTGNVSVRFRTPVSWILSMIITVLGWIVLFGGYLYYGKRKAVS